MILARIASALRRQDWFQVTIEVLIVMIGIFLGLQVQDWYEERQEKVEERKYLLSLNAEVSEILAQKIAENMDDSDRYSILTKAVEIIVDDSRSGQLSDIMCLQIGRSMAGGWSYTTLTSAEEIVASGKLNLIGNDELRSSIMAIRSAIEKNAFQHNIMSPRNIHIPNKYPELVRRIYDEQMPYNCDEQGMRKNIGFLNNIQSNRVRKGISINLTGLEIELLEKLVTLIEQELALIDKEQAS